nr:prominin-1-A-like isoform X1 [Lytechinus pictus]
MTPPRTCSKLRLYEFVIVCAVLLGVVQGFSEDNGVIKWDAFPPEPDYQSGLLQMPHTLRDINTVAVAFIQALPPKELPWDLYRGIINGTVDFSDPMLYVDHTVAFMALFAIAVIFMIFMPITGIIFCCCRCCDRCGAHMLQREEDNVPWKRAGFACGLLIVSIIMTIGIGISFIANQNVSSGLRKVEPNIQTNMDDLIMYVNQTVDEIDFLLDQVDRVKNLAVKKLDNISISVGEPVRDKLRVKVEPAIIAVKELHRDAYDAHVLLNKTNDLIQELQFSAMILTDSLRDERWFLNDTLQSSACFQSEGCRAARGLIDLNRLSLSTHYNKTNIEDLLMQASQALESDLTSYAISTQAILDSIPQRIEEEGSSHVQEIKQMVDDLYAGGASGIVDNARNLSQVVIDQITAIFSHSSDQPVSQMLYKSLHMAVTYDQYRFYCGIGSVCVFIIIILCNYLGVLFGECGRDKRDQPTERGCLSNLGGTLLLAGVAFGFLFSALLMLMTTIFFLAGGGTEKGICQPIETRALLRELIDYPYLLDQGEASFLGSVLLSDGNQPVSAENIINKCEQNAAILTTVDTNITTTIAELLLNYNKSSFVLESMDLSNFTTLDSRVVSSLTRIRDAGNNINITGVLQEISQSITKVNLTDYATILRTTANRENNVTLYDKLRGHAYKLTTLTNTFVKPMQSKVNVLKSKLTALHSKTNYLSALINGTLTGINEVESFVSTDGPLILDEEIKRFRDHLVGYLEQTADHIIYELTLDFGHCRPISAVYSSLDVVLCDYTSDSLNTLWFTLGGCVLLLIPSIVLAVKLSKYYRRMKFFEDIYGENDLDTLPMKAYEPNREFSS